MTPIQRRRGRSSTVSRLARGVIIAVGLFQLLRKFRLFNIFGRGDQILDVIRRAVAVRADALPEVMRLVVETAIASCALESPARAFQAGNNW